MLISLLVLGFSQPASQVTNNLASSTSTQPSSQLPSFITAMLVTYTIHF
jgi:hypothetical protein